MTDRLRGPNEQPPPSVGTSWTPPTDEWHFPRGDLRNTARVETALPAPPTVEWRDATSSTAPLSIPVATADRLVTAQRRDTQTRIRGQRPSDGTVQWRRAIDGTQRTNIGGVADGRVVFNDGARTVVALDIADGSLRWRQPLYDTVSAEVSPRSLGAAAESPTAFDATPLVTPDCVYVQSSYGLHGLNPRDGTEAWRIALSTYADDTASFGLSGGLAVAPGHVWASYGNRYATLFEIEINDGDPEVWMDAPPEDHVRRPVVTGDDPYAAALLAGFSGTTSDELPLVSMSNWGTLPDWSSWGFASVNQPTRVAPIASDGTQYLLTQLFQTDDGLVVGVVALHRRSGGIEWTAREPVPSPVGAFERGAEFFEHTSLCHPLIAGDTIITGYGVSSEAGAPPTRGMLLGYDVTTGQRRWQMQTDIAPVDLALGGDRLYVGGRGGLLGLKLAA